MLTTAIGLAAALGTTVSYVPQLIKAWRTGETGDVSLSMLAILWCGISLWVVYGIRQEDVVIVASNAVSVLLLSAIIAIKLKLLATPSAASRAGGAAGAPAVPSPPAGGREAGE